MCFRICLIEFRGQLNSHYDHLNRVSAQSIWIRLYRINGHLRLTMFSMNLTRSFSIAKWIFVKWSRKFRRSFMTKTRNARNKRKISLKYEWNSWFIEDIRRDKYFTLYCRKNNHVISKLLQYNYFGTILVSLYRN